jgi:hypothetical protein
MSLEPERWSDVYRDVPTVPGQTRPSSAIKARGETPHIDVIGVGGYEYGPDPAGPVGAARAVDAP